MILQYFKKKENIYKKKAETAYLNVLLYSKKLNNKKFFNEINFDTSFEISCIFLIIYLKVFKEKKEHKFFKINDLLFQIFINDLDQSFRKIGIGDMSIGKYVKRYVKKYYFRLKIFDRILSNFNNIDLANYLKNIKNINKENTFILSDKISQIIYEIKKNEH